MTKLLIISVSKSHEIIKKLKVYCNYHFFRLFQLLRHRILLLFLALLLKVLGRDAELLEE